MYGDGECVEWIFVSWGSFFVIFWRCVFVRMDKCRDFGIVRVVISLSCMHLFYHRLIKFNQIHRYRKLITSRNNYTNE